MKTISSSSGTVGVLAIIALTLAMAQPLRANLTVTSLNDSGPGSLRQAIAEAAPGDTIDFAVTGTITLTSGELLIANDLTISGPGATNLTVSGNNASRVFTSHCIALSISGIAIADGNVISSGGNGGGIQALGGALLLSDCVVSNCAANVGGGIYCDEARVCGFQLVLTRCTITRNTGFGGVYAWGKVAATDSTVCSNTGSGIVTVIFNAGLTNCTISGNTGDGIYWGTAAAPGYGVNLASCTICSNGGVGIRNDSWTWGTVAVRNTIIAGNSGGVGPDCSGGLYSSDYNLIQNTNGLTITGTNTHNIYNQDPLLGPLSDNGGPTPTHALLSGSPAIDSGSSGGLTNDQRGYARSLDRPGIANVADGSDIGAYEVGTVTLHVWQDSPNPASPYTEWTAAAHTIQDAVDVAMDGDTVLVTNGLYATGGRAVWGLMTNRVAIDRAILVRSVNGPAVTVIEGSPSPDGWPGEGAIRGAYVGNNAFLSGFTVTNGCTMGNVFGHLTPGTSGGGVWCEPLGTATNCVLIGNKAYFGAGAYQGTLHNCTLRDNSACTGPNNGFIGSGGGGLDCTLYDCLVSSNNADYYGGGVQGGTLYRCTIEGNTSAYEGGGVAVATLYNCMVRSNSASSGGGVLMGESYNCLIVGNFAGTGSGACGFSYPGPYAILNNCTVVGNNGGYGVYCGRVTNSIVANNSPWDMDSMGTGSSGDYSFIGGDPKFVNTANGDCRLRWDSPCIDAGTNLSATITNDIAGNPRPVDGDGDAIAAFDIGAYEFIPVPPMITNQPVTQTISPSGQATFTVGDTGNPPATYQWYFGDVLIPGATGSTFMITNAGPGQVGCYHVTVTNFAGGFVSTSACLWLNTLKMYAGVNVYGPMGGNCTVQYATNLEGNPVQWTTLTNMTIQTVPEIIIDYGSGDQSKRFYRTVPLP